MKVFKTIFFVTLLLFLIAGCDTRYDGPRPSKINLESSNVIQGMVTDCDGTTAVKDVKVTLSVSSGPAIALDVTNDKGEYRFGKVQLGYYTICFEFPDGSVYEQNVLSNGANMTVNCSRAFFKGDIAGRIIDKDGKSVIGAVVTCVAESSSDMKEMHSVITGEDGRYLFSALPYGKYRVFGKLGNKTIYKSGEISLNTSYLQVKDFLANSYRGSVILNIKDKKGRSSSWAYVKFLYNNGKKHAVVYTNDKGGCILKDVPYGKYEVVVGDSDSEKVTQFVTVNKPTNSFAINQ